MKTNTIYLGDCLQLMKKIPACSIDEIATDPPYGLKFMGQDWDKAIPPVSHFIEMHRVLKPGAFCFVFSSPRQDLLSPMIQRLGQAGFMIDFPSLYWTYATGIGLGPNCSKLIDKKLGAERKVVGTKNPHYDGGKRKILGAATKDTYGKFKERQTENGEIPVTAPASDLAREFDGAYIRYRPKPCLEVILVAMKPVETKTYIEQVMKNGKACTWLDRCRIPTGENEDTRRKVAGLNNKYVGGVKIKNYGIENQYKYKLGRYPTNILSSDNRLDTGETHRKSGNKSPVKRKAMENGDKFAGLNECEYDSEVLRDKSGSYNRYFCFDKWCRENLPKTYPFIPVTKPSAGQKAGRESHLTEKPPQIFAYLITLASRPGDIILDPYAGSGSCSLAAATLNRDYIAFEIEENHVDIARGRLEKLIVRRESKKIKSEDK